MARWHGSPTIGVRKSIFGRDYQAEVPDSAPSHRRKRTSRV
jgi:hypothetical protein